MAYPTKKYWLVVSPPLKDIWTNKNCSKPQTRIGYHPIKNCDFPVTLVYQRVHIPIFPNISYIMGLKTSKHFTKTIYPNISQYIPIYLSFPYHVPLYLAISYHFPIISSRFSPWLSPSKTSPGAPHVVGIFLQEVHQEPARLICLGCSGAKKKLVFF